MRMQFFFADAHDYIDPDYDFLADTSALSRQPQRDDLYAHEYLDKPPYDGILVSRAIVGDTDGRASKYSTAQVMRFKREGARAFLRYGRARGGPPLMGDCGAFSYLRDEYPPYTVAEIVGYYTDAGFTHGVSIDHVILGYDEDLDSHEPLIDDGSHREWRRRYDLTLELAEQFLRRCRSVDAPFVPIGVAQGWGPRSYRDAAIRLVRMGYDYIALGGLVPLRVPQIHRVVTAVRDAVPAARLHLFGFTKADQIADFAGYDITSFDSTSPMLRSFKDSRKNYMQAGRWYTAIRVPSADENRRFRNSVLAGTHDQRHLRELEQAALAALREHDARATATSLDAALGAVVAYEREFSRAHPSSNTRERSLAQLDRRIPAYQEVLADRPWQRCECRACRQAGIEVLIFRGSNRNRRRGFHNLYEFHRRLQAVR